MEEEEEEEEGDGGSPQPFSLFLSTSMMESL